MKKVVTAQIVEIALQALDPTAERQIRAWFSSLQRWDEDPELRRNSVLLEGVPGVYFLRTTTDIRIFFRIDGDTITVLDVTTRQAILASGSVSEPK